MRKRVFFFKDDLFKWQLKKIDDKSDDIQTDSTEMPHIFACLFFSPHIQSPASIAMMVTLMVAMMVMMVIIM